MRTACYATVPYALQALRDAGKAHDPFQIAMVDSRALPPGGQSVCAAIQSDPAIACPALVLLTSVRKAGVAPSETGWDARLLKPIRQSRLLPELAVVWAKHCGDLPSDSGTPGLWPERLKVDFVGRAPRILIAEDNVINQKVAVRMLEKLGLRPDVAANGREAVELAAMLHYDLILMDCQMPEMDGYAAAREIRRREGAGSHTVIIAMTAEAMAETRDNCLAAGMNDYISKPVRIETLTGLMTTRLSAAAQDAVSLR